MDTTATRPKPGELPPLVPDVWVWRLALAACGAIAVALVLGQTGSRAGSVQAGLCLAAMFVMAVAVYLRPRNRALLATAGVAALVGRFAFPDDWDSGRMAITVCAIVCGLGALILSLEPRGRRVAVSVLTLLHFGGILSAVTAPGAQPYLSAVAGLYVYRPYLQFVYLTNAYHFYSPEPGPANMLWFCVQYDGTDDAQWYKFPRRPDDMVDPLALSYYRRLSLTEQVNQLVQNPNIGDDVWQSRLLSAANNKFPFQPDIVPYTLQYRPPNENVRRHILPAYARYVARVCPHRDEDGNLTSHRIKSIKVYRVEHRIIWANEAQEGIDPYEPSTLNPYFQGEFDANGVQQNYDDPMLYWLVPIVWVPKSNGVPVWETYRSHPKDFLLLDGLIRHTGSVHWTDEELKRMGLTPEGNSGFLKPTAPSKEGK